MNAQFKAEFEATKQAYAAAEFGTQESIDLMKKLMAMIKTQSK